MSRPQPSRLQPRKSPQQARSAATVAAIHTATIQVLLAVGAARLTTTRVAMRAGVSVGTMYQYYPHKQALLFAVLERHLAGIEGAVAAAVERLAGADLPAIGDGLAHAWLDAKTADLDTSRALYGVAAEFDVAALMRDGTERLQGAIARLLATTVKEPAATAFMVMALLAGSTRAVMELGATAADLALLRAELPRACRGYLLAATRC